MIGLANAGADTVNSIKQAAEFGIVQGGQRLAGLLVFIADVDSLGLQAAQGLLLTEAYYWDQNDETRAFAKRFAAAYNGKVPTSGQAGVYGAVMHYLKAMAAAGTEDGAKVVAQMRAMPINDFMTTNGHLREDGRVMRDMDLFEVKKPSESKYPYDYYKQLATVPADQAYRPLSESTKSRLPAGCKASNTCESGIPSSAARVESDLRLSPEAMYTSAYDVRSRSIIGFTPEKILPPVASTYSIVALGTSTIKPIFT